MENTIKIPGKELKVLRNVDVCVIGAGSAGVAAAASAARNGARTLLIERLSFPGGTTTNGMVCMWHLSDGRKQVIHGVADELIDIYNEIEPDTMKIVPGFPDNMGETTDKSHEFRPEIMKCAMERFLVESKTEILYYTDVYDVQVNDGKIEALLITTKNGPAAVKAKFFIDCTGDGDVAYLAGAPCEYGRDEDGRVQGMSMVFDIGNIDKERALKIRGEEHDTIIENMKNEVKQGKLPAFGPVSFVAYAQGIFANMNPASGNPTDLFDLTDCTIRTRSRIFEYLSYFQKNVPGFENATNNISANAIGIRESRRVMADYVFNKEDVISERRFDDAVGHGFWCIDIHDPKGSGSTTWQNTGHTRFWLKSGHNYQIPFSILKPIGVDNLFTAGRCVSATHEGIASLRLQSHIFVMGQAVGTAAALCVKQGIGRDDINIPELQSVLRSQGAYIE